MVKFIEFPSSAALDEQLANVIVDKLQAGINQKGNASIVVSGGKTPQPLFELLSQKKLDWSKVYITLADERWVDVNDNNSNERLIRQTLLQNEAAAANFIGLKNQHQTPFAGASETENTLKMLPVPFDVVILGMGDDGHTASLFPRAENLAAALDMQSGRLCLGMTPLTAAHDRITLTLPFLLNSRHIYLHITGNEKRAVYCHAVAGEDVNEMPVRAVLKQNKVNVDVFWTA